MMNSFEKLGTITISVYCNQENNSIFSIQLSNENLYPVADILEDTLKLY